MVRLFNFVKDANVLWKTCIQAKTSIQYLAAKRGLHVRCTLGNTEEGRKKSILAVNYTMFAQNSSTNSQDAKKVEVDVTCHIFRSVTGSKQNNAL